MKKERTCYQCKMLAEVDDGAATICSLDGERVRCLDASILAPNCACFTPCLQEVGEECEDDEYDDGYGLPEDSSSVQAGWDDFPALEKRELPDTRNTCMECGKPDEGCRCDFDTPYEEDDL